MRRRNITSSKTENSAEESEGHTSEKSSKATKKTKSTGRTRVRRLAKFALSASLLAYIAVPVAWYSIPAVSKHLIFLTLVQWPPFLDLSHPEKLDLPATRNFYEESEVGVKLGVWHVLPTELMSLADSGPEQYEAALRNGKPIILYVHGNSQSRGAKHRIELYKVLRKLDFHIVTFDYRGYGDSSPQNPEEDTLVHDTRVMYEYLKQRAGDAPIFIWGHSLGTGVSTKLVHDLCMEGEKAAGLILEAPFNNIRDEVRSHPLAKIWSWLPIFDVVFLDPLRDLIAFPSDQRISKIDIPILILHAEDDPIVPLKLGYKLYEAATAHRPSSLPPVQFIRYDSNKGWGHRHICRDPGLPTVVTDFVKFGISNLKN